MCVLRIRPLSVVTPIKMHWCNNGLRMQCVRDANRVALGVARALAHVQAPVVLLYFWKGRGGRFQASISAVLALKRVSNHGNLNENQSF